MSDETAATPPELTDEQRGLIAEAESNARRKIAAILRDLEAETGHFVESISIENFDVTMLQDERQQLKRSVVIKLRPVPGSDWL